MSRLRFAASVADLGLVSGAGFLALLGSARWMEPTQFAFFTLAIAGIAILVGVQQALICEPTLALLAQRIVQSAEPEFIRVAAVRAGLLFVAAIAAVGAVAGAILWYLRPESAAVLVAAVLWAVATVQVALGRRLAASRGALVAGPLAGMIYAVLLLGGIFALHSAQALTALSACLCGAAAMACASLAVRAPSPPPFPPSAAPSPPDMRPAWLWLWQRTSGYALCAAGCAVLCQGFFCGLAWSLLHWLGPALLAGYKAMELLAQPLSRLVEAAQVAALSVAAHSGRRPGLRWLPGVVALLAVIICGLGAWLTGMLYQGRYGVMTPLLPWLLVIPVLASLSVAWRLRLQTALVGRPLLLAHAGATVVGVVAGCMAIPGLGLLGGALAAGTWELTLAVLLARASRALSQAQLGAQPGSGG